VAARQGRGWPKGQATRKCNWPEVPPESNQQLAISSPRISATLLHDLCYPISDYRYPKTDYGSPITDIFLSTMTPSLQAIWANFFIACAGAASALAGLVFVAVSVNVNRLIEISHLLPRAAATIGSLILILVASVAALIPQSAPALGAEILVFAILCWGLKIDSARNAFIGGAKWKRPRFEAYLEAVLGQIQVLPFMVGGMLLLARHESGLYWIAAGSLAIFLFSMTNAWILLVEILR
jgi:hypothetical protein